MLCKLNEVLVGVLLFKSQNRDDDMPRAIHQVDIFEYIGIYAATNVVNK